MWEVNRRFSTQFTGSELYAHIASNEVDEQPESQPIEEYVPNVGPSNNFQVEAFNRSYTEDVPSSSFQVDNPEPSSSLPPTEDVMDDFEDEEEFNFHLNASHEIEDGTDDDDFHEERDEGDNAVRNINLESSNAFFTNVNMDVAMASEFSGMSDNLPESYRQELFVGQMFNDIRALRRAAKLYSIRVHHTFKVRHSSEKYEEYQCVNYGNSCTWRLRANKKRNSSFWQITRYKEPHTCVSTSLTQDHPKLDADIISSSIIAMVTERPDVRVSQIIERIRSIFGYTVTYKKAWTAKQIALGIAFGNWEDSYSLLPRWLAAVQYFMPGSRVEFMNKQCSEILSDGQPVQMFRRVFWAFKPCIDAFDHLKPIVQVDGTFLYGKYKGTFLLAISQDGDRNVVPIAFALVEGETRSAWSWFLYNVRRYVVKRRTGVCLISDRHPSIISAVADPRVGWQPPNGYHVFCLRHVAANLHKACGTNWLKEKFINIGYAYERHFVDQQLAEIALVHEHAARWIGNIPKEKWSRAYDEEGRRYGHMTTNLAECMNGVFKGVRSLPVTGIVKATMYRVNSYFVKRAQQVHAQIAGGQVFSETLNKKLAMARQAASACIVREFDRRATSFEVVEPLNIQCRQFGRCCKVCLTERKCDCGEFQIEKCPCMHVIAACSSVGLDHLQFIDPVFTLEYMRLAYNNEFHPVGDEIHWPSFEGPNLIPDPAMIREKGRPQSTRIRNEMDWTTPSDQYRCGLYRQLGHNRSTCPQRLASRH